MAVAFREPVKLVSSSVEKDVSPIINENGVGAGVGAEPPPPPPPHEDKTNTKVNIYKFFT